MAVRELEQRHINSESVGYPQIAIAPIKLVNLAGRVYRPEGWELTSKESERLRVTGNAVEMLCTTDSRYQLHLEWFQMCETLEDSKVGFGDRIGFVTDFFIRKGFIDPTSEALRPFGAGLELMDLPSDGKIGQILVEAAMADYWKVKRALAAPNSREIMAALRGKILPPENFAARESFLLRDSRILTQKLAQHDSRKNRHVCEIGPGKCENTALLHGVDRIAMTVVDFQEPRLVARDIRTAWRATRSEPVPEIIVLDQAAYENTRTIQETPQAIHIVQANLNQERVPVLDGIFSATTSIFVRHHMENPVSFAAECARIARPLSRHERAAMIFDGVNARRPFANIFIPVGAALHAWGTLLDGAISFSRGWNPAQAANEGRQADKSLSWHAEMVGPDVEPPFLNQPIILSQLCGLYAFDPKRLS